MTQSNLDKELQKALKEIGSIKPIFSPEDGMYVFEHAAYPYVFHADTDKEATKEGYIRALKGFIEERLAGNVASFVEEKTSGRGGARAGAGRPKGSKKTQPTKPVRVPEDMADWLRDNLSMVRAVMKAQTGHTKLSYSGSLEVNTLRQQRHERLGRQQKTKHQPPRGKNVI